jgi:hypothetical protein
MFYYVKKLKHYFVLPKLKKLFVNRHSMRSDDYIFSSDKSTDTGLKVLFGNNYCSQPYLSSVICNEAIAANNNDDLLLSKLSVTSGKNFFKNADEIIKDSNEFKVDRIWQIVPGYKGCRTGNYNFNTELFRLNALKPFVKMIELKLIMPSEKNTVSVKRNVQLTDKYHEAGSKIISRHTAFSNPESMALFLDSLRQLSDKKPVGIKVCIRDQKDKKEFHEICYAFRKTGIIPDYIAIADDKWESDFLFDFSKTGRTSLYDGLLFISKTLEMYGLEKQVKIIAATSIYTAFDVLKLHALGADAIRMQNCMPADDYKENSFEHTNNLRYKIIRNTTEIMKACGYTNFQDITLTSLLQRFDFLQSRAFSKIDNHKPHIDIKRKPSRIQKVS